MKTYGGFLSHIPSFWRCRKFAGKVSALKCINQRTSFKMENDTLIRVENSSEDGNISVAIPMFYTTPYRIVGVFFASVIFIVGLLGNVLVVIVVARTRTMHTTTNCYLVSLAVADCIVLLSATLPSIPEFFVEINVWIWGGGMCPLLVFLQYLGSDASALSITAFTVERYIAICHPMKAQTMCTVQRAKRIIAALWLFAIAYCAPWLALISILHHDGTQSCEFRKERGSYVVYYMSDLMVFYVIPILVTTVLYGLIARILLSSTIPKTPGGGTNGVKTSNKKLSSSRKQVIRMLAVVVSLFATLWMPYRLMVVYNSFAKERYLDLWFMLFCRIMVYINSAINPILYNAMSVKFRRAFRKILRCGPQEFDMKYVYSEVATDTNSSYPKKLAVKAINGINFNSAL